jgi:hypothetical protein
MGDAKRVPGEFAPLRTIAIASDAFNFGENVADLIDPTVRPSRVISVPFVGTASPRKRTPANR